MISAGEMDGSSSDNTWTVPCEMGSDKSDRTIELDGESSESTMASGGEMNSELSEGPNEMDGNKSDSTIDLEMQWSQVSTEGISWAWIETGSIMWSFDYDKRQWWWKRAGEYGFH